MSRMDTLLAGRFQIVAFRDLPVPYQLAVVHYMALEAGDAWSDLTDALDFGASPTEIKEAILRALPRYVTAYGDCLYGVAVLPAANIKKAVMEDAEIHGSFDNWQEYHEWYAGGDLPGHAATDRWPVVLSSYDDETLQDGWHRLHSYIRSGHADIPAVFYPEQRHRAASLSM